MNKILAIASFAMVACLTAAIASSAVQEPPLGPVGCSYTSQLGCRDVDAACSQSGSGMTCFYPGQPTMCDCHQG